MTEICRTAARRPFRAYRDEYNRSQEIVPGGEVSTGRGYGEAAVLGGSVATTLRSSKYSAVAPRSLLRPRARSHCVSELAVVSVSGLVPRRGDRRGLLVRPRVPGPLRTDWSSFSCRPFKFRHVTGRAASIRAMICWTSIAAW